MPTKPNADRARATYAFIGNLSGKLRDGRLLVRWFLDSADARAQIEHRPSDYSLPGGLADTTPKSFANACR
jgi:hypothetical protein